MRKAAVVLRILEMSLRFPGMVISAEPQILVDAIWIDNLAGIHLPIWVPDRFEFAKGLNQLLTKRFVEELGFRLAVAVLAAEAAAILNAKIGSFFHKRSPFLNSRGTG